MKTFIPENNAETPFNTRIKTKKNKDGSIDEEAIYVVGTLQATYMKTARMWQIIALVSLSSFIISLFIVLYAINLPSTVPVIVTVDNDGFANYVGKVDKSYWGNQSIPENAKTYQIKKLISNMYTQVTDRQAQNQFIQECINICQKSAITQLDTFFIDQNPFNFFGIQTRTVKLEEPMKQTNATYVTYYTVETYKQGRLEKTEKYSILTTLEYFEGTPETNPLGIYISNFDIKLIK